MAHYSFALVEVDKSQKLFSISSYLLKDKKNAVGQLVFMQTKVLTDTKFKIFFADRTK